MWRKIEWGRSVCKKWANRLLDRQKRSTVIVFGYFMWHDLGVEKCCEHPHARLHNSRTHDRFHFLCVLVSSRISSKNMSRAFYDHHTPPTATTPPRPPPLARSSGVQWDVGFYVCKVVCSIVYVFVSVWGMCGKQKIQMDAIFSNRENILVASFLGNANSGLSLQGRCK